MALTANTAADRLVALLDELGLQRIHLAACMSGDWEAFVTKHPKRIASLTIVQPHLNKGIPASLERLSTPALVVTGDQGAPAERARELVARFASGALAELNGYFSPMWADTLAERTGEAAEAMLGFLAGTEEGGGVQAADLSDGEGEIAGIRYRVEGRGSPLVLLPLSMAPSQWAPLMPQLTDRYCTITLGGPHIGAIALLEGRARSAYGELVGQVLEHVDIAPGEAILEVGCGSGALARGLAVRTSGGNPITATDINPYLLAEARILTERAGLGEVITFEEADAAALPYADESFDVALSCTVMEEGDADGMLGELARVLKPEGRLVAMTRAVDVNWATSLSVPKALAAKLNVLGPKTGAGVAPAGCADESLYRRVYQAGLVATWMLPQFAVYKEGERRDDVLDRLFTMLAPDEAEICRIAVRNDDAKGLLYVAEPFHCIVAVKPPKQDG